MLKESCTPVISLAATSRESFKIEPMFSHLQTPIEGVFLGMGGIELCPQAIVRMCKSASLTSLPIYMFKEFADRYKRDEYTGHPIPISYDKYLKNLHDVVGDASLAALIDSEFDYTFPFSVHSFVSAPGTFIGLMQRAHVPVPSHYNEESKRLNGSYTYTDVPQKLIVGAKPHDQAVQHILRETTADVKAFLAELDRVRQLRNDAFDEFA